MQTRNKSFLLSISFFLITLSFAVSAFFLFLITNSKIATRNTSLSEDIEKYYFFDNKLNFPQHKILSGSFERTFFISGTVKNVSELNNSTIIFHLNINDYFDDEKRKHIVVGNILTVSTIFGDFDATIFEIDDVVKYGKIEITATFNNSSLNLLKGMDISTKIFYGKYDDVIAVPKDYVYQEDSSFYVYKLNKETNDYEKKIIVFHEELKIEQLYIISSMDLKIGDYILKVK